MTELQNPHTGTGGIYQLKTSAVSYDSLVSMFDGESGKYSAAIDFLLDLTTFSPQDTVVDLGCGTGLSTERLAARKPGRIIGVEPSEAMLAQARAKFQDSSITFAIGAGENLSRIVRDADKIVAGNVFKYFSDPSAVLRECYAALNSRGEFLFNTPVVIPGASSIYAPLFSALVQAMREEFGPAWPSAPMEELARSFEPKHDEGYLTAAAQQSGFQIQRYEERAGVSGAAEIRSLHTKIVASTCAELEKIIGKAGGERISERVAGLLEPTYTQGGRLEMREAYVCLRKA